jgi:hypothetical protein
MNLEFLTLVHLRIIDPRSIKKDVEAKSKIRVLLLKHV